MKNLSKKTISLFDLCVGILVFLFCFEHAYVISSNSDMYNILSNSEWIFYFVLIGLIIGTGKYNKMQLVIFAFVGVSLCIVYIQSGYAAPLKMFIVIMAAKGRNFDHIVSIIFNAYICAIFVTVLLYLLGISNSGIQRRGYSAIGFGSANVVGGYILICYLIWLYKARNHIKILIVTAVIALFVYFVINNRSVVFLTLLAPLCLQCFKHLVNSNKGNIILKNTIVWLPVICILICIITAEMYPINSVIQKIDVLFNQRIYLNYRNITLYGVKIFGQYIIWGNGQTFYNPITGTYSTYNTVDNSYICLLIQMGVAMTVIYVLLFAKVAKKCLQKKMQHCYALW